MSAIDRFKSVKAAMLKFMGVKSQNDQMPEIPVANDDEKKTAEFVQQLFDEGLRYESDHFGESSALRLSLGPSNTLGSSPEGYRLACENLVAGNLWEVLGHRNQAEKDKWKSEVVEGLTQRNMRIRGSYISSTWHDITIVPNVQYINDIINEERGAVGWSKFIGEYRDVAQRYGSSLARVFFEDDEDGGHVRMAVVKPGTCVRSPNSSSFAERDGCTYVVQGTMINQHQLRRYYPDQIETAQSSNTLTNKFNPPVINKGQYQHTKMYAKLELFMDDETMIERPVTPDEEAELNQELQALALGTPVERKEGQNSKIHVKAKTEALSNFLSSVDEGQMSPEDGDFANQAAEAFALNIDQHVQAMDAGDPASMGLTPKYPFGRYICSVGGQIDEDTQNPYMVPWRSLFQELKNENVYGRNDGRSDPEIYFHDEKTASRSLSQFLDTVVVSMPKRYRGIEDKENKATNAEVEDNDITAVGYYVSRPPVSISGQVSQYSLEMRKVAVDKAQISQGINSISIGGEPTNQSSGFQTQLLQRQNEVQVSGELDGNMRTAIENIVETMISLYKVFYAEPRIYTINGVKTVVNVQRMLTQVPGKDENGQPTILQNPRFEITAKPFSNYPNRFEVELATIAQIYGMKDEMGAPIIPVKAIYDVLAMKYPQAAPGGEWARLSEATRIGMQVLAEQKAMEQQKAAQEQGVVNALQGQERKAMVAQMGGNGEVSGNG